MKSEINEIVDNTNTQEALETSEKRRKIIEGIKQFSKAFNKKIYKITFSISDMIYNMKH